MTCELFFWGKKLSRDFFIFYRDLKAISRTIQMVLEQKDFLYQEKLVKVTVLKFFRFVQPESKKNQRLAVKVHIRSTLL